MKRFYYRVVAGIGMMLATTAGVASANLIPLPPLPAITVSQTVEQE